MAAPLLLIDGVDIGLGGGGGSLALSGVGSGAGGGGGLLPALPPPTRLFDLSPLAGKRDSDRIRGNTVADIRSALEVYNTGYSSGRGYGYAQDVMQRFGAPDIRAGAASYLQAAGLTYLADVVQDTGGGGGGGDTGTGGGGGGGDTGTGGGGDTKTRDPIEILGDVVSRLFGNPVYNPPLQSQASGYTPISVPSSGSDASGGFGGITMWLILGAVAIGGYFLYKKYKG
jgi:hypothetical protein